jgi:hypothetical protein
VWLTVYAMRSMAVRLQAGGEQPQHLLDQPPEPLIGPPPPAVPLAAGPLEVHHQAAAAPPLEGAAAAAAAVPGVNDAAAAGGAGVLNMLAPQPGVEGDGVQDAGGGLLDTADPIYRDSRPRRRRGRGARMMAQPPPASGTRDQQMGALSATLAPAATRLEPLSLTVVLVGRKASHLGLLLDLPGPGGQPGGWAG